MGGLAPGQDVSQGKRLALSAEALIANVHFGKVLENYLG